MLRREIEIVVFLRNTEIFEERKHMVFFTVASKGHQQIEHNFLQLKIEILRSVVGHLQN